MSISPRPEDPSLLFFFFLVFVCFQQILTPSIGTTVPRHFSYFVMASSLCNISVQYFGNKLLKKLLRVCVTVSVVNSRYKKYVMSSSIRKKHLGLREQNFLAKFSITYNGLN